MMRLCCSSAVFLLQCLELLQTASSFPNNRNVKRIGLIQLIYKKSSSFRQLIKSPYPSLARQYSNVTPPTFTNKTPNNTQVNKENFNPLPEIYGKHLAITSELSSATTSLGRKRAIQRPETSHILSRIDPPSPQDSGSSHTRIVRQSGSSSRPNPASLFPREGPRIPQGVRGNGNQPPAMHVDHWDMFVNAVTGLFPPLRNVF